MLTVAHLIDKLFECFMILSSKCFMFYDMLKNLMYVCNY